jgi:CRISPR-associated protein Cmr1
VVRELPPKRPLPSRAGLTTVSFEVPLRLVTPLLGGAAETRAIDDVDIVRAPSVRGHLRSWWRALQGGRLSSEERHAHERRLWGGAGDETGGRSTVEIRVAVDARSVGKPDTSEIMPYGRNETHGAYAL